MLAHEQTPSSSPVETFLVDCDFFDRYAKVCGWKATLVYLALCRHQECPGIQSWACCLAVSVNSVKRGLQELRRWHIVQLVRRKDSQGKWLSGSFALSDKSEWINLDNKIGTVGHEVIHRETTAQPRLCGGSGQNKTSHSSVGAVESKFTEFANKIQDSVGTPSRVNIYNINNYNYNNIFNKNNNKYYEIENSESNLVFTKRNSLEEKEKREKIKKRAEKIAAEQVQPKSPGQVMLNFLEACRVQDARYLRLLQMLEQQGVPRELAQQELTKFCRYWTERNSTGTQERWELEKTFELTHRLSNWFNHLRQFQREKKGIKLS
jgi:hypothetical protein